MAVKELKIIPTLKVNRQGSRIKTMSFGGISWVDSITCFCAGATSLDSMARSCNISHAFNSWLNKGIFKYHFFFFLQRISFSGIFPWSLLCVQNSYAILAQPELPRDPSVWQSDLGGKKISQQDIDEARSQFQARNMTCCDAYLNWYLTNIIFISSYLFFLFLRGIWRLMY